MQKVFCTMQVQKNQVLYCQFSFFFYFQFSALFPNEEGYELERRTLKEILCKSKFFSPSELGNAGEYIIHSEIKKKITIFAALSALLNKKLEIYKRE